MRRGPRAYDPLAMQKVVGSNPIIRFARNPLQTGRFSRLGGWPHVPSASKIVSLLAQESSALKLRLSDMQAKPRMLGCCTSERET
jgi:hypothetical protein